MHLLLFLLIANLSITGCTNPATVQAPATNLPNLYDRRAGEVALRDEQIEISAREALSQDVSLASQSHINVNVFDGKVLLTGEALSEEIHKAIVEKLRIIPGVAQIYDEIDIAALSDDVSRNVDSSITNRVRTELNKMTTPPGFSSNNIKVVTEGSVVYLLGLVYRDEADIATSVTQQVPGVLQIVKLFEYFK